MDLLLKTENLKSYYLYVKDFNSFMYKKTKHRERGKRKLSYSIKGLLEG